LRFRCDPKAADLGNQNKEKRDFSLRRPTDSQERIGRKESACSVRNDVVGVGSAGVVIPMHKGELKRKTLRGIIQDLKISVEEFANLL
jgi:hypothetical protein